MTASITREKTRGFAHLEILLIGGVVVIIGAVGYLFYQNIIANKPVANTATTAANTSPSPAPAGTTASIDQITQQDAAAEAGVDSGADSQSEQNAASANSAVSNIGSAYDENGL